MTWQHISTAPRDGKNVLVIIGETIPDLMDVRVGSFLSRKEALTCGGYPHAGWLIWNTADDWFVIPEAEATYWMPLPDLPVAA